MVSTGRGALSFALLCLVSAVCRAAAILAKGREGLRHGGGRCNSGAFSRSQRKNAPTSGRGPGGSSISTSVISKISEDDDLGAISAAAPTRQTAACWRFASHDGRFIYPANAATGRSQSSFKDRAHFFRASAEAMRHILVDRARRKKWRIWTT